MVDIIFNGTSKRPAQNMAEVHMIFDNTSKKLPIDFDEVTVTRKIYRSGESEYFLNKVQCRLKDIRDLFLDTGIGSQGYAIMDQGGVNFILEAKPEERRELFEEAAGVSKYKVKRDEAISKLAKVDADIARVSDTAILISEQIKTLDSQARKARLYKRYKEQLKDSDIAISVKNSVENEEKLKNFLNQFKPLSENIANIHISLDKFQGELAALSLNLTYKQNEINELNEKTANCKYLIGKLEGDITSFDNLNAELKEQIGNFDTEDGLDEKKKQELLPQLEKMETELRGFENRIKPTQDDYNLILHSVEEKENKFSDLNSSIEKLGGELMNMSQSEIESSRKIAFDQSGISHIDEDLINLAKERDKKVSQLDGLKKELDGVKRDLENQRMVLASTKEQAQKAENEKKNFIEDKIKLQEQMLTLKNKKAALGAKLEMILNHRGEDPYWLGTQEIENSKIEGVEYTLGRQLQVDPQDKIYIEEIFGQFLDSVICQSKSGLEEAVRLLKSKGGMRAKFIILSAIGGFDKTDFVLDDKALAVKSRLKYPECLENLVHYLLSRHQFKNSTDKFWVADGAEDVKPSLVRLGGEEEIKQEIEQNEQNQSRLKNQIDSLSEKIENLEIEISQLMQSRNEETVNEKTFVNLLENKMQALDAINEETQLIESEKKNLFAQKEEREKNLLGLKKNLVSLSENRERIKKETEHFKEQREELACKLSQEKTRIEDAGGLLNKMKNEKMNLQADLRSLEMQKQNILSSFEKRSLQRTNNQNKISGLEEKKLSCRIRLKDKRDELKDLEVEQTRLQEELVGLKSEYDKKISLADSEKANKSKLDMKAAELEMEIKNLKKQNGQIVESLIENWQTDLEQAKLKYRDFKIDYEKVKSLKRRIENMGPVNMTAPEEYDALTNRHRFLTSQIQDLENAKSDLKSAINKINAATRENFRHTFDKVRENFQKIYRILFEGGEADIVLTQPENLLETGVEIVSCPPGKKTQNISALSGGEQALTAIALLFSFFVVNPSPFCVLDEADAPLDEANIDRFVNLLKQFVKNTQFLIVTHNKRTMESADTLYGITMQEFGVSKVVSVELERKGQLKGLPETDRANVAVA
jgi:chromosome segregation protein